MKVLSKIMTFKLIKDGQDGKDGKDGAPGKDGQDGTSPLQNYLHIMYSKYSLGINSQGNSDMSKYPTDDTQYIGITTNTNPTPPQNANQYKWSKFRGEDGKDGEDGEDGSGSNVYIRYSKFPNGINNSENTDMTTYPTHDSLYLGIQVTSGSASSNAKDYTWAKYVGEDGKPGTTGPVIYPAGEWNSSTIYTGENLTKPFVSQGSSYYYLISNRSEKGVSPSTDVAQGKGNWAHMENFSAIITQILFADFAKLGSFVVSGDFLISQKGVDNTGNSSIDYHKFPSGFTPNFMVNGKTGQLLARDGEFRGKVIAESGTIGGFEINDYRLGATAESAQYGNNMYITNNVIYIGKRGNSQEGSRTVHMGSELDNSGITGSIKILDIENSTKNKGIDPDFETCVNMGLYVKVTNADNNVALWSDTGGIVCTGIYGESAKTVYPVTKLEIYPNMGNTFMLDSHVRGDKEVRLPPEDILATRAGYATGVFPVGFCWEFTLIGDSEISTFKVSDIIDFGGNIKTYTLAYGDVLKVMAIKTSNRFMYKAITYTS